MKVTFLNVYKSLCFFFVVCSISSCFCPSICFTSSIDNGARINSFPKSLQGNYYLSSKDTIKASLIADFLTNTPVANTHITINYTAMNIVLRDTQGDTIDNLTIDLSKNSIMANELEYFNNKKILVYQYGNKYTFNVNTYIENQSVFTFFTIELIDNGNPYISVSTPIIDNREQEKNKAFYENVESYVEKCVDDDFGVLSLYDSDVESFENDILNSDLLFNLRFYRE